MTKMKNALACLTLVFACGTAFAAPKEVSSVIKAPTPYGQGSAGALFITAYDAALWTDAPTWSMDEPFAFTITYKMAFDTSEFVERAIKEMKHVDPQFSDAQVTDITPQLNKAFPPVKSGDRITALYQPGHSVTVYKNGARTGTVAAKYAKDFFGIWLSPNTSDAGLRRDLLKRS